MALKEKKKLKVLLKQAIMTRVLIALVPCVAGSIYFFGWRSLVMILISAIVGFITEYIFTNTRKEPVTQSVFVTTTIYSLIMPPTVPWHVLIIGVIFAVMFTKEIFGGFGKNFFNPAMAGRCFVYICFPLAMTAVWAPVAAGKWGALDRWTTVSETNAVTSATPMTDIKNGNLSITSKNDDSAATISRIDLYKNLFFGRIRGTAGVTSALLILIGGTYLYITKTASRTIILSLIISYAILNQVLFMLNVEPVNDALAALLGGGFLFGAFYMATDPVSAPRTNEAKIAFGIVIAICTVVIRNFSIFNGGLMFSILFGNMFAPLMDKIVREIKAKNRPEKAK
ncbi:MAG: Na(+)-translocating NADH-quinone reductase subunit B [Planctomycetes bacterium ADurb.Bin401]|nr:MAG: Na(+)-translocating NADH-quinone reductase subunit B [Planctomycetes bacterium ADurb.Bin401]